MLDINMPGLDGFQTKRALDRAGSRVPVVFLSMFDSEEYFSEAFGCGGRGYVLKPRVAHDLATALRQARLGGHFAPSLASLFHLANGGGHAMLLYRAPDLLLDGLAELFDLALRRGDATCVISTPDIRLGLTDRLRARGWDIPGHPRCRIVDADEALERFMNNGLPDLSRLAESVSELDEYRLAVCAGADSRLTIYGNMSALLSAAGNANAAIALERSWDLLTRGRPFFTVCGYSTACFREAPGLCSDVCAEHWAVAHATN